MYLLMNKDNPVASFSIEQKLIDIVRLEEVYSGLPIGCTENTFSGWVERRHTVKHHKHLSDYLKRLNADNLQGFISLTHAISINDTFWVKEDCDDTTWKDISPYCNDFDETVQNLSFDGVGIPLSPLSSTSPEFSTEGTFLKCWKREDNGIYLYKRGTEGFSNSGLEPYSEMLASQVFVKMNAGIPYGILEYRGKIASKCKLFTNESVGFIPQGIYCTDILSFDEMLSLYDKLGFGDAFRRMIVCDAITFNTDRHLGNFGFLFDTMSLDVISMAPCFDYNLSLFPMEVNDEFANVNSFINRYTPSLGTEFVKTAKYTLTDNIISDLKNLNGFSYEYSGDSKFTKERVKYLTDLSNQQINHILGTSSTYVYTSPSNTCVTNIYKYMLKYKLTEEEFYKDVPRLMAMFDIKNMSELEEKIATLL